MNSFFDYFNSDEFRDTIKKALPWTETGLRGYEVPPGGTGVTTPIAKTPEQIAAEKAAADKAAEEAARKAAAEAFQARLNGILTKNQNFQTGQSNFLNSAYEGAKARMAPRQIAQPYNTAEPYSFTRDQAYTDPRQFLARSPTGFNKDTVAPPSAMTPPSVQPPEYGGGGGRDGGGGGRNGDGHGGDGDIRIPEYGQDFTGGRYEGAMIQGGYDQYGNLNGSDASRRAIANPPTRVPAAQLRTFAEGGLSSLPQSPYYMTPDLLKPVNQDTVDTAQPMYRDRVQAITLENPWTKEEPKPKTDSLLSPEIQATVLELSQGRGNDHGDPTDRTNAAGASVSGTVPGLTGLGLSLANSGIPGVTSLGNAMMSMAERSYAATPEGKTLAERISQQDRANERDSDLSARVSEQDRANARDGTDGKGAVSDHDLGEHVGQQDRANARDGTGEARGGFNMNGKYYPPSKKKKL